MEHKDRFRVYGLVPYNISPIQQGIQFSHALQEYNNDMEGGSTDEHMESWNTWRNEDKTVILLNGGTSTTMEEHTKVLDENGIFHSTFREPDLNNMVTGIVFLVPEQVYKRDNYPDFKEFLVNLNHNNKLLFMMKYDELKDYYPDHYDEWVESVGGERNAFLKEFTSKFKLA